MSAIDRSHTLYRFYDAEGRALYIGTSVDPTRRIYEHTLKASWRDEIADTKLEEFATKIEALNAERAAIFNEQPIHNIRGKAKLTAPRAVRADYDGPPILNHWALVGLREIRGISSGFLARALALTEDEMFRIEAGAVLPTRDQAEQIARVLVVDIHSFIVGNLDGLPTAVSA